MSVDEAREELNSLRARREAGEITLLEWLTAVKDTGDRVAAAQAKEAQS